MYISNKTRELVKKEYADILLKLRDQANTVRQAIDSGGGTHDNAMYDDALHEQKVLAQKEERYRNYLTYKNVPQLRMAVNSVSLGTIVKVIEKDTDNKIEYCILGPADAELSNNKSIISYQSPLAVQLLGKEVGDEVLVVTPAREYRLEVLDIIPYEDD